MGGKTKVLLVGPTSQFCPVATRHCPAYATYGNSRPVKVAILEMPVARKRLRELVNSQPPATPLLPLTHTTDVYGLINALDDQELVPHSCDVFVGEPLLYFFYGRPSYRVNSNQPPTSLDHYLPVCLLFRSASTFPIKRIFPFDTGGFEKDLYADALHKDMKLEDFGLDPDPSTPGKVISLFFGTVDAYLRARPLSALKLDPKELEAISFHALISSRLSNNVDNRSSGVEIQLEGRLDLRGNIEAIILPGPLLESQQISAKLSQGGIVPLPYPQIDRQRPSEYVTKIFDLCYEYYSRVGPLNVS